MVTDSNGITNSAPKSILFFAECVTLAHFARVMTLAKATQAAGFKTIVACDDRFLHLESETLPFEIRPLYSIPCQQFANALAKGDPLYNKSTLIQYAKNDLTLIDDIKPDVIIGDFRLSLAISAPLRNIPYMNIANAYWSPYANTHYPIPDLPLTRLIGTSLAQHIFNLVRPAVFSLHARALNSARKHYGLPSLGNDLREVYTWGNQTLYADVPELVPLIDPPSNQHYIGPVLWSTQTNLPPWWNELTTDRPIIAICMGSSGQANITKLAIEALAQLPITILATGISHNHHSSTGRAVILTASYLPIADIVNKADVLICNGGSLTCYQALSCQTPILGIASNMDQFLNMAAIAHAGLGLTLRASTASHTNIRQSIEYLLSAPEIKQSASSMANILARYNSAARLIELIDSASRAPH